MYRTRAAISLIALLAAGLVVAGGPPAATAAVPPAGPPVTVTGTVVDAAGNPVADASVHGARTQSYTVTNGAGAYTLSVPDGTAEIIAAKEGFAFGRAVRTGTGPVTVKLAPQSQALPRAEYPRPDADRRPFTNNAWQSLNGTWSFDFDPGSVGEAQGWFQPGRVYGKAIQVPFPYQSLAAFGEQQLATHDVFRGAFDAYNGPVWYRRAFTVPQNFAGQSTRLRIGAAYWGYSVWLDGQLVQPYVDYGDTEWVVDLGALAPGSAHTLVIRVVGRPASGNSPFPIGRHDLFANKGGIWQSVWIEPVKAGRLGTPQAIPNVTFTGSSRVPSSASATVNVTSTGAPSGTADVTVKDPAGTTVGSTSVALSNGTGSAQFTIPQPKLWDIKQPNLYTVDVTLTNGGAAQDGVRTSFGLRKVERKNAPGTTAYQYIWLNNRPVYIRGLLDQGNNPWGTATPTGEVTGPDFVTGTVANPAPGSIVYDLKHILAQGYNLTRPHVKIFEPSYYYWADKLGLLVWLEMPNSGREQMFDNNAALFNQFKPRYEGLLKSALAINRNRASVVIWTTFNEGWGVVKPFGDLEPTTAIPFIKSMVALIRSWNPGVLVNDNSACCENGHTSVTDINDVHAGLGGFDNWKAWLDEYNAGVFPGSTWKMAEGTQSGQPWLMGESTISGGGQLVNFGMYRSYPKLGGYVGVQFQDQEGETASQYTYDRQNRGPGFIDHTGAKRGADIANGDDAVVFMRDTHTTVTPGETVTIPVKVSHWSDLDLSGAKLHWKLAGRDRNGAWVDPAVGGSKPFTPTKYTVVDAGNVSVTVPSSVHSGYIWVWLETTGGQTAAENLLTFTDSTPVPSAFDPMSPIAESWSGGTAGQEFHCGPQHAIGYGSGYFDYAATVPAAAQNGGTLTFEASSAEAPHPTEHFFNDPAQATTSRKFPTGLSVTVDGQQVSAVTLPDDPADALGVTSRMFGKYNFPNRPGLGNHYGYRVSVPLSAALLNGKTTVTVRLASNGGGLRVFGMYAGDHGLPPQIVPGTVPSQVPAPKPTVTDRPSVVFTPAQLNANNTGTAYVSVVNDTNSTISGVQARLHLPTGWSATPVGSANVGSLPPAGHAHVAYTVTGPAGATGSATATAVWTEGGSTVRSVQQIGNQPPHGTPGSISNSGGLSQSLSGDSKAELACVNPGGTVMAYYNNSAISPMQQWPYGGQAAVVGTGMSNSPAAVHFADLDADGKTEIIHHRANGELAAWKNVLGFGTMPWGASVVLGTKTVQPERIRFADIDGDKKADLIEIQPNGEVKASRNAGGLSPSPWDLDKIIATGMTDLDRVHFMDLNADRKAEIAYARTDGQIQAWQNVNGFTAGVATYGNSTIIASFTEPQRVKFGDLNNDGKAELLSVEKHGFLRAWRNVGGFAPNPYLESAIIAYGFTRPELLRIA